MEYTVLLSANSVHIIFEALGNALKIHTCKLGRYITTLFISIFSISLMKLLILQILK